MKIATSKEATNIESIVDEVEAAVQEVDLQKNLLAFFFNVGKYVNCSV